MDVIFTGKPGGRASRSRSLDYGRGRAGLRQHKRRCGDLCGVGVHRSGRRSWRAGEGR